MASYMEYADAVEMYNSNRGLLYHVLYENDMKYTDDIIQEGAVALWKACLGYNKNLGTFSTYACKAILRAYYGHIKNHYKCSENEFSSDIVEMDFVDREELVTEDNYFNDINETFAKEIFNEKEIELAKLLMSGYTISEIARMRKVSRQLISQLRIEMQRKTLKYFKRIGRNYYVKDGRYIY